MKALTAEAQTPRGAQRKAGQGAEASEPGGGTIIQPSIELKPARDPLTEVHGPPLLLTQAETAHILGVNRTTVYRLENEGRMPPAFEISTGRGQSRRWRRADIESWVGMGCPSAREWEARRESDEATKRRSDGGGRRRSG